MNTTTEQVILNRAGVYRVSHPERTTPFVLSVMRDSTGAVFGAVGYEEGNPRPRRGKHLLLTPNVREWVAELSLVEILE